MSVIRALVYASLTAFALALALLPRPNEHAIDVRDPFVAPIDSAMERFVLQSELYRRSYNREVARAALARVPRAARGLLVVPEPGVPASFATFARNLTRDRMEHPTQRDTTVRTVIVAAQDPGATPSGVALAGSHTSVSTDVFLPGSLGDSSACVVVVSAMDRRAQNAQPGEQWQYHSDPAAACGWFSAYGVPGRGIQQWLDSTHAAGLYSPRDGVRLSFIRPSPAVATFLPVGFYAFAPDGPSLVAAATPLDFDGFRTRILACAAGRPGACAALVLSRPEEYERHRDGLPIYAADWVGMGRAHAPDFIGEISALWSMLEHRLGAAQFARLWKSNDPLPVAFEAVHGESLDTWLRRQILSDEPPIRAGPVADGGALLSAIAAVIIIIALAARAVSRREMFA